MWLTVKEVSKMLGVTEIHLRRMIDAGRIPYLNVSAGKKMRSIRINKEVIDKFIAEGGVQA